MPRILTKLRIDEISSVDKAANEGAKIMLYKRDNGKGNVMVSKPDFWDTPHRKNDEPRDDDDEQRTNTIDDDKKLSGKLKEMVAALITVNPSLSQEDALYHLIHTAHGRALAEHLNSISKTDKEPPMNRSEEMQEMRKFVKAGGMATIAKRIIETGSTSLTEQEYTECVQEAACLNKVSFEKAFADPTTQQAYKIIREASYVKALGYGITKSPNMMSLEPTQVGGQDAMDVNTATKAYNKLQEKVAEQRKLAPWMPESKLLERVFAANPELVKASVWHSAATR